MQTRFTSEFSNSDLGYILFNNRSPELFFKTNDTPNSLFLFLESKLAKIQEDVPKTHETILKLKDYEFLRDADDVLFYRDDFKKQMNVLNIESYFNKFSYNEKIFIRSRGFNFETAKQNKWFGLSQLYELPDYALDMLGITLHPALSKVLIDEHCEGICMPTFDKLGLIENVTIRRIDSDKFKMKYSQAMPCTDIHFLTNESIDSEVLRKHKNNDVLGYNKKQRLFVTEGFLDMFMLWQFGEPACSVSSAHWNALQYYKLFNYLHTNNIKDVIYWADNDYAGIRAALIFKKMIGNRYNVKLVTGPLKDACDSLQNYGSFAFQQLKELSEQDCLDKLESMKSTDSVDVTNYLQKRQF